ncbi:hypothetical protein TrRE_jg10448, partial [Triparma retinervis]
MSATAKPATTATAKPASPSSTPSDLAPSSGEQIQQVPAPQSTLLKTLQQLTTTDIRGGGITKTSTSTRAEKKRFSYIMSIPSIGVFDRGLKVRDDLSFGHNNEPLSSLVIDVLLNCDFLVGDPATYDGAMEYSNFGMICRKPRSSDSNLVYGLFERQRTYSQDDHYRIIARVVWRDNWSIYEPAEYFYDGRGAWNASQMKWKSTGGIELVILPLKCNVKCLHDSWWVNQGGNPGVASNSSNGDTSSGTAAGTTNTTNTTNTTYKRVRFNEFSTTIASLNGHASSSSSSNPNPNSAASTNTNRLRGGCGVDGRSGFKHCYHCLYSEEGVVDGICNFCNFGPDCSDSDMDDLSDCSSHSNFSTSSDMDNLSECSDEDSYDESSSSDRSISSCSDMDDLSECSYDAGNNFDMDDYDYDYGYGYGYGCSSPPPEPQSGPPATNKPLSQDWGVAAVPGPGSLFVLYPDSDDESLPDNEASTSSSKASVEATAAAQPPPAPPSPTSIVPGSVVTMPRDGACFFHSALHCLQELGLVPQDLSTFDLRQLVCDQVLADSSGEFQTFWDSIPRDTSSDPVVRGLSSLKQYVSHMRSRSTFAGPYEIYALMQLYGVNIQTYQPSILEPTKHQKKLFHNPNPSDAPTIHLVHLDKQLDGDKWLLHYDVFEPLEVPPQGPEIVDLSNELGGDNEAQVHLDVKDGLADKQYYSIFSNKRKTPPTAHTINIPTPELMTKKQKVIAKNLAAAATKATTTASNPLTTSTSVPAPTRPQPYLTKGPLSI